MGVVVFDADVLIAFLDDADADHEQAVPLLRGVLDSRAERWLCAVTLTELLVPPVRDGTQLEVDGMLGAFGFRIVQVDKALAERAAAVRAKIQPMLKVPDAYVLATAIHAERRDYEDVRIATFDERLRQAHHNSHQHPSGRGHGGVI